MPSNGSSAAVLTAPRLGARPGAGGSFSGEMPRRAPSVGTTAVAAVVPGRRLRRVFSTLGGLAEVVAVSFAFPLGILAVGIPIALLVRLAIWTVHALSGW